MCLCRRKCQDLVTLLLFMCFGVSFAQDWQSQNNVVMEEYKLGHFQEGIFLAKKAIASAEKEFGKKHDHYATSQYNFALYCNKLGYFAEAEKALLQGLSIIESLHGTSHLEYINTLYNLGNTYFYQEEYAKSESTYLSAKSTALSLYNKNDAFAKDNSALLVYHYSNSLNGLGRLYKTMGQYQKAITSYEEILMVLKNIFGDYAAEIDIYPSALNNLANVYASREEYAKAEPLYAEILKIQAAISGTRSVGYITYQNNLASVYMHSQQWDKAETLYKTALDTLETVTGKEDMLYISMLNNLATLYFEQEKYSLSEKANLEAKSLQETYFGTNNSMYQLILFNLAQTYQFMNRYDEANRYYQLVVTKTLQDVEKNFSYLTEDAKKAFYQENKSYIDDFSVFALQKSGVLPLPNLPKKELSKQSLADIYNIQLATKAIILNASSKMRKRILESGDTNFIDTYENWENLKNEIAQTNALKTKERSPKVVDSLVLAAEKLETELALSSSSFRQGFQSKRVGWEDVRKKLRPGEAAVEIVSYYKGILYVALIVTPQTKKHPEAAMIKSSKEKDLEKQFLSYYKNCIRYQLKDTSSYNRMWKPIFEQVQKASKSKITKIYLSPDGMFNEINLNTLQNPATGQYVLDEVEIQLLTNTKELVESATVSQKPSSSKVVLFGRPTYSLTEADSVHINSDSSFLETTRSVGASDYEDLPQTEREVKEIHTILVANKWQSRVFLHEKASENNLKKIRNPTILHIATHGFFLPNNSSTLEATLRSGVILAGVNNSKQSEVDDGILTAYEAMNLNLDSTDLVVLSTCESGLGEIEKGEGVYGFQRTLRLSGAKTVIMSLWKVEEHATRLLMSSFYQHFIKTGNKRMAFREAQKTVKALYPDPVHWGPFVMVGE